MIVDRIEGAFAVVEIEHGMQNIPLAAIEGDIRDGAVLISIGKNRFKVNEAATCKLRQNNIKKLQHLFNNVEDLV